MARDDSLPVGGIGESPRSRVTRDTKGRGRGSVTKVNQDATGVGSGTSCLSRYRPCIPVPQTQRDITGIYTRERGIEKKSGASSGKVVGGMKLNRSISVLYETWRSLVTLINTG